VGQRHALPTLEFLHFLSADAAVARALVRAASTIVSMQGQFHRPSQAFTAFRHSQQEPNAAARQTAS
jgi:hypothetical protein